MTDIAKAPRSKLLVAALFLTLCASFNDAQANAKVSVLYSFAGGSGGAFPNTGVIFDSNGNVIGGSGGGDFNGGIIFQISPAGEETVLHSFDNTDDGSFLKGGLIADKQGNIYGTTYLNGPGGYGTVFKLAPGGAFTVLYAFKGGSDGGYPSGTLARDNKGNLYGVAGAGPSDLGIVFKVAPDGTKTTLHAFTGGPDDGAYPGSAQVALDKKGNVYGTASQGGANARGVVFKVTPKGAETIVHSFNRDDGEEPGAGVIIGKDGNLYGTTESGGANLAGTVFELTPAGQLTTLYSFAGGDDGSDPGAGVVLDKKGNVYGTTSAGGTANDGTVFGIAPDGTRFLSVSLQRARDGSPPTGSLAIDRKGDLYGTAYYGGAKGQSDSGTVYKVKR